MNAPAVREVATVDEGAVRAFVSGVSAGRIGVVVFLTGVGAAALFREAERLGLGAALLDGLRRATTVCRGPKPAGVLGRHDVPVSVRVPEPHTTADVLRSMAAAATGGPDDRPAALRRAQCRSRGRAAGARGAVVEELCLYEWRLPVDLDPLRRLVRAAVSGDLDAVAFTSQIQARHLFEVARDLGLHLDLVRALTTRVVVAAVGPTCAEALRALGMPPHVVPERAEDGPLVAALAAYLDHAASARRGPPDRSQEDEHDSPDRRPAGTCPTLIACFLHFDLSFMLWVLLGALGVFIADELGLCPAEKGLMVARADPQRSLLRIPLGLLSDRFGGKRVGIGLLALLVLAAGARLAVGRRACRRCSASASCSGAARRFVRGGAAAGQPLVSAGAPGARDGDRRRRQQRDGDREPRRAARSPTCRLAQRARRSPCCRSRSCSSPSCSWPGTSPERSARSSPAELPDAPCAQSDLWWFCLFYSVTFGGYVGLSSFLPLFFRDQYAVSAQAAGVSPPWPPSSAAASRPLGGYLADRVGGVRLLSVALGGISLVYALGRPPARSRLDDGAPGRRHGLFGIGNGAVFQLVPQRFRQQIGVATGVVGAVGGLGGFLLPTLLGTLKQVTGSFGPALALFAPRVPRRGGVAAVAEPRGGMAAVLAARPLLAEDEAISRSGRTRTGTAGRISRPRR